MLPEKPLSRVLIIRHTFAGYRFRCSTLQLNPPGKDGSYEKILVVLYNAVSVKY